MKPFKKQERYIVIKRKNLSFEIEHDLREYLSKNSIATESGVFIQSDSPAIDQAWALVAGAKVISHNLDIITSFDPEKFIADRIDIEECQVGECEKPQISDSDFCLEHTEQSIPPKSAFKGAGKLTIKPIGDRDALMVDLFTSSVSEILKDMQRQELWPSSRALVYSLAHLVGKANPDREHMHRLYGDWLNVLRTDAAEFIRYAQKSAPSDKHIQEIAERVQPLLTFELSEPC